MLCVSSRLVGKIQHEISLRIRNGFQWRWQAADVSVGRGDGKRWKLRYNQKLLPENNFSRE